jgi:hypothetical protein
MLPVAELVSPAVLVAAVSVASVVAASVVSALLVLPVLVSPPPPQATRRDNPRMKPGRSIAAEYPACAGEGHGAATGADRCC